MVNSGDTVLMRAGYIINSVQSVVIKFDIPKLGLVIGPSVCNPYWVVRVDNTDFRAYLKDLEIVFKI